MNTEIILEKLPFLTVVKYIDKEYIGIITNSDTETTSFYPFSDLLSEQEKKLYIHLGLTWWWETNRKLPISISLLNSWRPFLKYSINFVTKEVKYIGGRELPSIEKNLFIKTKRKNIRLKNSFNKKIHRDDN